MNRLLAVAIVLLWVDGAGAEGGNNAGIHEWANTTAAVVSAIIAVAAWWKARGADKVAEESIQIARDALSTAKGRRQDEIMPHVYFPIEELNGVLTIHISNFGRGTAERVRIEAKPREGLTPERVESIRGVINQLNRVSGTRSIAVGYKEPLGGASGYANDIMVKIYCEDVAGNPYEWAGIIADCQ